MTNTSADAPKRGVLYSLRAAGFALAIGLFATFMMDQYLTNSAMLHATELASTDFNASFDRGKRQIERQFHRIYDSLRLLAVVPGIQKIDRYAKNFDVDARADAAAVYDNLISDVKASEIYIVPADLEPDQIDPRTGKLQTPVTTFDDEIVGRSKDSGDERNSKLEEVEIYEYRAMKEQIRFLRTLLSRSRVDSRRSLSRHRQ